MLPKTWAEKTGTARSEIAEALGVCEASVHYYLQDPPGRIPSPDGMAAWAELTNGAVKPIDFHPRVREILAAQRKTKRKAG